MTRVIDNGVYARFDCGFKPPARSYIEIVEPDGTLEIPVPSKPGLNEKVYLKRGDQTETIKIKGWELYIGQVEDLADQFCMASCRASVWATAAAMSQRSWLCLNRHGQESRFCLIDFSHDLA